MKIWHSTKFIDDILRDKPHTLSESEEKILASVSELTAVPESVYDMLAYADMEFPEIEGENGEKIKIDHFNYSLLIKSRDRRVRKDAFEGEFSTYKIPEHLCIKSLRSYKIRNILRKNEKTQLCNRGIIICG